MEREPKPLPRSEKIKDEEPKDRIQSMYGRNPRERSKERAGRAILEFVRRRTYESAEKMRLRKKLRQERNRLRKLKRTNNRREKLGGETISQSNKE